MAKTGYTKTSQLKPEMWFAIISRLSFSVKKPAGENNPGNHFGTRATISDIQIGYYTVNCNSKTSHFKHRLQMC